MAAIDTLLGRGLIKDTAEVYGAGEDTRVAQAFEIKHDGRIS